MWHDLLVATALMLVIEGILPFLNPAMLRQTLATVLQMDDSTLRFGGFVSMLIGVVVLYLIK